MLAWRYFLSKTKEDNMKINKEKEVKTEIHKKNNGKSHQIYVWEVINTMSEKLFICEKNKKEGYKR